MTTEITFTPEPVFLPIKVRRIMRVVAKAILIRTDNGEEHWLPLSQVKPPETPFKQNQRNLTIEVTEWVVEQKRIGMSQKMPPDVEQMIPEALNWNKTTIAILADRIRDSDGSWLDDCLRTLVGLPMVHQEIKTIGDFIDSLKKEVSKGTYNRIVRIFNSIWGEDEWKVFPMDKLTRHTQEDFLGCPGFGRITLDYLRLCLHQNGFLLEGDTRSAVEQMEADLWGVEDDDY